LRENASSNRVFQHQLAISLKMPGRGGFERKRGYVNYPDSPSSLGFPFWIISGLRVHSDRGLLHRRENPSLTIACRSVKWCRSAEPTICSSSEGSPTEPTPVFSLDRAKSFRFLSRFVREWTLLYSGLPVDGSQTGCQREAATDRRPCGAGNRSGTHCSVFRAG
jgi:hypothetical protein